MSESAESSGETGTVAGGSAAGAAARSAGAMLRHIRESAGIDVGTVAAALKITPQTLEALEQDRYQALPGLAFARSLAASICRNFGVDPEPVLAQMPHVHATELPTPGRGINAPFHSASDRPMPFLPKYVSRPLTVVVALFLLGSLLLWLWPTLPIRLGDAHSEGPDLGMEVPLDDEMGGERFTEPVIPANPPQQQPEAVPSPAPEPDSVDELEEAAAAEAEATDVESPTDGSAGEPPADADTADTAVADGAADADAPPAPDPDAGVSTADGATTEPVADAPPSADDLVIEASGESWISVRDAAGKSLFNRLLEAGETARISGAEPLSVTIGRKDAVTVQVHGEPFDHLALSNSSVSRFKVN